MECHPPECDKEPTQVQSPVARPMGSRAMFNKIVAMSKDIVRTTLAMQNQQPDDLTLYEIGSALHLASVQLKRHAAQQDDACRIQQQAEHIAKMIAQQKAEGKIDPALIDEWAALGAKSPEEKAAFIKKLDFITLFELMAPYEPVDGAYCGPSRTPEQIMADQLGFPRPIGINQVQNPNVLAIEFDGPVPAEIYQVDEQTQEMQIQYAQALIARLSEDLY